MTDDRSSRTSKRYLLAGVLVLLAVSVGMMVVFSTEAAAQTVSCDAVIEDGDSIQSAVNNASEGDTICVQPGTYAEEVMLNVTGLTLMAADEGDPPVLDGTGLKVGVSIAADDVLVEGFEIRNYEQLGIDSHPATTSTNVTIRNTTITDNSNGIRAGNMTDGAIVNNSIVENAGNYEIRSDNLGIQVFDSEGIEISGNNISRNGDVGIEKRSSTGSQGSTITNNTLIDNGVLGIDYGGSLESVVIADNLVVGPFGGIEAGSDAVVRDNVVEVDGTGISGASGTEIENNSVTGRTIGISLGFASDTIVRDNVVTASQVGIRVEGADDIGASESAIVTNNTASGNSLDLRLENSQNVAVTNNTFETGVGLHANPIAREDFVHTFENNTVQGDPLFYATGVDDPAVPETVGQVLVANATNVTVTGHEFDGVAAPIQVYFSDDAEIEANTIENDTFVEMSLMLRGSISVWESNGTSVRDNHITGGPAGEISIQIASGREVAVVNNTVIDSPSHGILVEQFGVGHEIRQNTVSGASEDGILVDGFSGLHVADNVITGNARYGIHVRSEATNTLLTGNTVTHNAELGIRVLDSTNAWIEANDVSQNDGAGLLVEGESANATIVDNVANANIGPGIHVRPDPDSSFDTPDNVTVQGNEARDNDEDDGSFTASFYGIRIEGIETALVGNNFVTGNDRGGILVEAAVDVQVGHNNVADNGDVHRTFPNSRLGTGIHVIDSSAVTVHGNTVTDNPVHGIEVVGGSENVDVSDNNVEQNTRRGVFVEDANDVRVKTNIIRNNDIGIFVASITAGSSADSVILSGNLVELNTREGVIVTGADELYAEANEFLDNAVGVRLDGATVNATLRDNEISGNTMGINGSAADDVVDARENWWGADNGPSGGVADPETGTLADGDGDPVSENVRFDPWSTEESLDGADAGVIASSLVHVDGTEPDLENISVDAFVASGLLQIQLVNTTADSSDLESVYELGGVDADETTVFEIEVQVNTSDPRVLVGSGNVSDWQVVKNGDGTTNVTIVVSPITQQTIVDCDTYDGCTPPLNDWPTGDDDHATVANDATVNLAADPLTTVDTALANRLNGTILTTDAQAFGSPVYDPLAEELSVFVAAPSKTVDDTQNEGFYRAFLPDALLGDWGVENATELKAAFDGEETDFEAEDVAGGISIAIDMTYSSGEVTISTLEPASFDVGITNANDPITEGQVLDVTVAVENTGDVNGTQDVRLTVDGDEVDVASVNLSGGETDTITLAWTTSDGDAGDYTATVASENDSATASVTVESGSSDSPSDSPSSSPGSSSTSSSTASTVRVSALLEGGETSVDLDENVSRLRVTFSDDAASGSVTVESLDARPDSVTSIPDATEVAFVDVTVPSSLEDAEASLRLTVSADAIGDAAPSDLVVYHYDDAWTALDTTVVSTTGDEIVLEATTPGFSTFAIGSTAQQPTPGDGTPTAEEPASGTPTPTATPTPSPPSTETPAPSPTETSTTTEAPGQPGFGLLVALAAVALFGLSRRGRD